MFSDTLGDPVKRLFDPKGVVMYRLRNTALEGKSAVYDSVQGGGGGEAAPSTEVGVSSLIRPSDKSKALTQQTHMLLLLSA